MLTYEQMLAQREQHAAAMREIEATIRAEGREMTDEDRAAWDAHQAKFDKLTGDIEREEKRQASEALLAQSRGRKTDAAPVADGTAPAKAAASVKTALFSSFGEFAQCVQAHALGQAVPRLNAIAPQASTVTSTDGFPIPADLRSDIQRAFEASDSIVGRCLTLDTASNEIKMPAFESIPGTTGALRVYWTAEDTTITPDKVTMGEFRLPLHKVAALVPVTEEVMADAPLVDSFIRQIVPEFMADEIDATLMFGTGVGQPLGVLDAPATIEVAKEGSQAAATINFDNIRKMWSRLHPRSRATAVWMVSTDLEAALMTAQFAVKNVAGTENVGGMPIYLPAGSIANQPYATLLGRPVIVTHHGKALGTKGDIVLVDWRRYGFGRKTGGVQIAQSMHLYFDRDKSAFRFTYRVGGQPLLSKPIAQRGGGSTLSAFVTLATRA